MRPPASVVRLYAALFPGFLLAGLYVLYVVGRAIINKLAPKLPKEETDVPFFQVVYMLLTSFFPLALLIMAVLGAILFGLATPTEARRSARSARWCWRPGTEP